MQLSKLLSLPLWVSLLSLPPVSSSSSLVSSLLPRAFEVISVGFGWDPAHFILVTEEEGAHDDRTLSDALGGEAAGYMVTIW